MEYSDIKSLYDNSIRKILSVNTGFKRYLYPMINWNNRLIGIKGVRGVGKTTLVLQHIKENFKELERCCMSLWMTYGSLPIR